MKPENWPKGASEQKVRECSCPTCRELINQLETLREQESNDGEHKPLTVYTDA